MDKNIFKVLGVDDKDQHHWYEGYYWRTQDTTYCFTEDYERNPEITHDYIVFDQMTDWGLPNKKLRADINPDTLCQLTGKRDSNKKHIWEHDIVKVTNTYNNPATVSWYVVRYFPDAGAFVFTDPKGLMYNHLNAFHDKCIIEVMGNEFDNPELLGNIKCQTPEEFQDDLMKFMRERGFMHD